MTPGVVIIVALLAILVVGVVVRRRPPHPHHPATVERPAGAQVGAWEVCRCGAARQCGDRRWRRGRLERLSRAI